MRQLVEARMELARREVEGGQEVMPHFVAWEQGGQAHVIATPWRNEAEKAMALQMLTLFFAWKRVDRYMMMSEAWMVVRGAEQGRDFRGAVSEQPDRQEIVSAMAVSRTERLGASMHIVRDGKVAACGPIKWTEGEVAVGGRMANLLPPPDLSLSPAEEAGLREMFASAHVGRFPG